MAGYKPLANQKNVVTPSNGNMGVRFKDSTGKVAGILNGGVRPMASKGASGGCKSCGR